MKVCIVNEFFYPDMTGGTGMLVSDLARRLHDNFGVEVDVITTRHLYRDATVKLPRHEEWDGINVFRMDAPNFNRSGTAKRLLGNLMFSAAAARRLLSGRRYDVVLTATAPPTIPIAAQAYRRIAGVPYVYVIYDLEPDRVVRMEVMRPDALPVRLLRRLQHGWLGGAARVVVIGRCMRDYLAEHYGLSPEAVEVIPVGADPDRIQPAPRETGLREKLGLNGFVVLYAGNFGKYHNFDMVLDAAKEVAARGSDIVFALVGNGAKEKHIHHRIAEEGITNVRVFPIMPQDQMPELLATADVSLVTLEPNMEGLCVPSKFYPILASGRPTVAMVGENSEIAFVIAEAECGVRVPQDSGLRLAEALLDLSASPDKVREMGSNARRVLVNKYTTDQIAGMFYHTLSACVVDPSASGIPAKSSGAASPDVSVSSGR